MSSTLTNKVLSGQARELVFRVFKYFEATGVDTTITEIKNNVKSATGISIRTIENIIREGNNPPQDKKDPLFSTPGKNRNRKRTVTDLQDYEKSDFRSFVYNFHKTENCRITVSALRQKLISDYGFKGGDTSLRKILKSLGFRFRKAQNNRRLLIEKSDIRARRIKYLKLVQYYREQNRPIVYLDETYIHSGHTISKTWNDNSTEGLFCPISKGARLIIIDAGWKNGFVPNCRVIFKSGTSTGDYHTEMNGNNYEKWVREKLIPNLPEKAVVVVDNAPYHNVQINKAPNSTSKKCDMVTWLSEKNIPFSADMLKPQLYAIVKEHKTHYIEYKFDSLFQNTGHTILRLPPYHPDLNPIEMIWADVKNRVAKRNVNFKLDETWKLAEEEFATITAQDWEKKCDHVIKIENNYLEHEVFVDITTDQLIIKVNSGDTSDSDIGSDTDSDDSDS